MGESFINVSSGIPFPNYDTSGGQNGNGGSGTAGLIGSIIGAAGGITTAILNRQTVADQMKYSALGSNGFLYTQGGIPGQPQTVASISSTTLLLLGVAAIVVVFLFMSRK